MKNPIRIMLNYYHKYGFNNLYGGTSFFDKDATVNEYLNLYTPEHTYDSFNDLYTDAVKHVGIISFEEKTKNFDDYFYILNNQDKITAILIGIVGYFVAKETDANGGDVEKAIDKFVGYITNDNSYDTNNPFDTKAGLGHRMFGHDPATFAFKNIPSNYLIYVKNDAVPNTRKTIQVGKYLGLDDSQKFVSMWDIIWKFYGNESFIFKGIWNCISHTVIHFSKDLFTPDGLPIPFTSLFEHFDTIENTKINESVLHYRNSIYKTTKHMHLKASDFTSLAVIEIITKLYCEHSPIEEDKLNWYKDDMKLISMSTCIMFQCSSLIFEQDKHVGKKGPLPIIDGAKINLPLLTCNMNIIRKEIISIHNANRKLNLGYERINL